ncbi:hypothetical protein [Micromonospora zamorensis]|uniref:hypothetical protein n=1 Tax=Micromonospora zamorensis TaxID=709883 RepID=UPI003791F863
MFGSTLPSTQARPPENGAADDARRPDYRLTAMHSRGGTADRKLGEPLNNAILRAPVAIAAVFSLSLMIAAPARVDAAAGNWSDNHQL